MNRARTYHCTRMRHCIEQSNGPVPSLLCPSWVDCIIATRGYDFREGEVLIDPLLAAQLSNAVLAAQAFQHDADLLLGRMMPTCGSANIPDCLFNAVRHALARLSHRCSSTGYDEPEIPSYAISPFCPTGADGLHAILTKAEVATLLKAAGPLYLPVLVGVTTGMRRGEILGLRWSDIDLKAGKLTVNQSLERLGGKTAFKPPKTAGSRR